MTTLIKDFNISRMTYGSSSDFHNETIKLITTTTPEILHVEAKIEAYRQKAAELASLVNRATAFVATPAMRSSDKVRDNALGTIGGTTDACLTSPVAEKQEAAVLIHAVLAPYRGIGRHEYTKQTAEVDGLLVKLDKEENKAAIATLGLTGEVDALRTANEQFKEDMRSKREEVKEREAQITNETPVVVADLNDQYRDIVQVVNAYAIVQPSDEITQFIADMNALIEVYSQIAGSSTSGGEASTDTPTEGGETEEGGDEEEQPGVPHP